MEKLYLCVYLCEEHEKGRNGIKQNKEKLRLMCQVFDCDKKAKYAVFTFSDYGNQFERYVK